MKRFILALIGFGLLTQAFSSFASCKCPSNFEKLNKDKYSYLIFDGHASVSLIGKILGASKEFCAYSYLRNWGVSDGRVSQRLLVADEDGHLLGAYTIDVVRYIGVSNNKVIAINMNNRRETIGVVTSTGLAKTIFFDGEVYPLIDVQ